VPDEAAAGGNEVGQELPASGVQTVAAAKHDEMPARDEFAREGGNAALLEIEGQGLGPLAAIGIEGAGHVVGLG
jgi:hypothetical protein